MANSACSVSSSRLSTRYGKGANQLDDPAAALPVAIEAVARATNIVRERVPLVVTAKRSIRDMATDVDLSVENAVREFLHRESPDTNFLGEERGISGKSEGKPMWVLDPIDGTANFLHRLPLCAVSLGLIDGTNGPWCDIITLSWFTLLRHRRPRGVSGRTSHRCQRY
ncbi:MAG: inositol monophosphatase family protein [Pseudonocardiaceae bacterium]